MSVNTNKNILITSGLGNSSTNAVSQIDFKWFESGLGTFVFTRNLNDIRSSIYNWVDTNEPVLLFGGMGTISGQQYFVGPYQDYVGSFSGIASSPSVKIYPISGKIFTKSLSITGPIYDNNNSSGNSGNILTSSGSGLSWTTLSSYSVVTGGAVQNQITVWLSTSQIGGFNTFVYYNGNLGLGTVLPTQTITVQGNALISGITTSTTFSGSGSLLTNLNASNLTTGTISSTLVTGSYPGITSVGVLTSLIVNGITTSTIFSGSGSSLTNLNASNLTTGTIPSSLVTGSYPGITSVGALTSLVVNGISSFNSNIFAPSISSVSNIDFNTNTQILSSLPGRMFWDVAQQELAITLLYNGEVAHLGQDQVQQIYNNTGNVLGVGTVVYYNGVYSGWPTVSLADATVFNRGVGVGVIQNAIGVNSYGYVHISGPVTVNTLGYSTGPLYLSTTPGILTSVQPSSPNFSVNVAYAINSQSNGQIIVWPGSPLRVNQTGSILFADAQGKPGSSFTSFFIDVAGGTYNVGIGTNVAPNRLSVQGSANFAGSVSISTSLTLNAAQGISPLIINSTTQVNNLNAQYWSGNVNPATQTGDMFYASGVGGSTISRVPGNTSTGLLFLGQAGDGVNAGAPSWQPVPSVGFLNYFLTGTASTGVPGVYRLSSQTPVGLGTITTTFGSVNVGIGSFITDAGVPNLSYLPTGNLSAYAWISQSVVQASKYANISATFYEANGFGTVIGVIGTSNSITLTNSFVQYILTYPQTNIYNFKSTSSRIQVSFNAVANGNTNTVLLGYGDGRNSYVNIPSPGADVTNFVPYNGAVNNVSLGNFGITANNFDVFTSPIGFSTVPGRISWNISAGKPQVGLSYNNETANLAGNVTLVYNGTGSIISQGNVVYVSGVAGVNTSVPTIALADNVNYSHALGVGVVAKSIGIGSYGYIHIAGSTNVDTTSFNPGDILYVGASPGILTNISPYAPNFNVVVGVALNSSTNGSILVQPSSPGRINSQGAVLWANSQGFPIGVSSYFFIDDAGGTYGVGIGTTMPGARLDINVATFPNNKAIVLRGALNQTANIFEVRDSVGNIYNSITGIGSVGISTASPQTSLHVVGTSRIDGSLDINANITDTKNQRIFAGANTTTTSTSFIGISSIFVPVGFSLSIDGKANGYASGSLNESGKFFASYYNNGTLTQVGNSDVTSKYTGSFGNFDVQGIGSNVTVVVKSDPGANLWYWGVSYDYLLTQNF